MIRRLASALGLPTLLQACSPLAALNAAFVQGDPIVGRDVAYGPDPRQRLDVYAPPGAADRPVVVFIYGGSWQSGARRDYRFVGARLAAAGFITVVPDYRLYPQASFPAFVEDAAAAVAWTARHVAGYGGDAGRIVVAGHSAGAQIAALAVLDRRYLPADVVPAGLVGIAGPYAFDPFERAGTRDVFTGLENPDDARPIAFARPDGPPTLLLHGRGDDIVHPRNAELMAARLRALGVPVAYHAYDGVGHIRILLALYPVLSGLAPTAGDLDGFVRRNAP